MSGATKKACWVYVFAKVGGNGPCSPVKIGISDSPFSRLAALQTACPFEITDFWIFECPDRETAKAIEKCFHEVQSNARLHGEWFDFSPIVAVHLLCVCFRTMLDATIKDQNLIGSFLDCAGVFWAERKFGLSVPGARH